MAANTAQLDVAVLKSFMDLPQGEKIQAEYIWLGGSGQDLRCKTRTLPRAVTSVEELPMWNYDGSSTGQAAGHDSEVLLQPVAFVKDPFRRGDNILVLCETVRPDGTPLETNKRREAAAIFEKDLAAEPWFGIEQEYTLFYSDGVTPLGWPVGGYPKPQGPYYCGVGVENSFGRAVVEAHYRACLYAGVTISGVNAEVMCGQWEYQVGPCTGIESGDHLWFSRYIMTRVCEAFGVVVSFDPKPMAGDWNGAGCHTNYSTKPMREAGGYDVILAAIKKLEPRHAEFIAAYGEGNERRLTGAHETASIESFSYGVANRGASVRIPRTTEADGYGYFEDRRPASNMDPYVVTSLIFRATHLE